MLIEKDTIIRNSYAINWEDETSLTEAAVNIWADFFDHLAHDPIVQYNRMDIALTAELANKIKTPNPSRIKDVIFNGPATIVFWADGTKTVVKCQAGDEYDMEKGLAMAISKKALGNQGNYCKVFQKWCADEEMIYPNIPNHLFFNGPTAFNDFLNAMKNFNNSFKKED